ncbi:MAG: response regulator receiver protein [Pedosphaera sp.]|nr:response regulator receiver protein [Pedosphaera sp.]
MASSISAQEPSGQKILILLVDDSMDDRLFFKRALKQVDFFHLVGEAEDGVQAMSYIKGEGIYSDREKFQLPDLIILDLKMPRMSGFDFLKWFREHGPSSVKVVVYSGSMEREDARRALALGADFYQTKPADTQDQIALLRSLEAYMIRQHRQNG